MNKKVMHIISVVIGLVLLTGCGVIPGLGVNKKADAVKAAKASIAGLLQGDKSAYDDYYGQGKFDEKMNEELKGKGVFLNPVAENMPEEAKKKQLELFRKLFSKSKVDYEEKSETEVTLSIHQMHYDVEELSRYIEEIHWQPSSDEADASGSTEVLINGIEAGKIKLVEKQVIKETMQLEEKDGKLYVKSPAPEDIMSKMITSEIEDGKETTQSE